MASDAGSARATNGMWVTSQVSGGTSDNSDAMTAPGTLPAGPDYPESSPSLHNDPAVALPGYDGRHLTRGRGES
jgi:hypothetical protein